jgi:UDP-N-acetylmuramyl pentapeptide phosphotransferase/UDP-N-acetylglucosamine-1-phosphate transferase
MPEAALLAAAASSGSLCALMIVALHPLLVRYALARPNARSSHRIPTPQGGGIAIIAATIAVTAAVLAGLGQEVSLVLAVAGAAILLAILGALDDIRPLPAAPRLLVQILAVAAVVIASGTRILPEPVPLVLERALLILGGVWFVNLVNFMDGLDWITVAEIVPVSGFLGLLGAAGILPPAPAVVAAALCGAMLGFAPFNRPVAQLFLGDVGSLPIGLVVGWLLLELAGTGALAAAVLLPLYYLADATLTLLRRLAAGERVWEAHRSHFYQRATDNGFSAKAVAGHVLTLNVLLAALAAMTLVWPAPIVQGISVLAGAAAVALQLRRFSRPRRDALA